MTVSKKIREKISQLEEGKLFTVNEFKDMGSVDNVRQLLNRMSRTQEIKRVARGVYSKLKKSKILKESIEPSLLEIAKCVASKNNEKLVPHGASAAKQLALSTQVAMKYIFHTNGHSRKLKINGHIVELRHTSPSKLVGANSIVGIVLSALHFLGKEAVSISTIEHIKNRVTEEEFSEIIEHVGKMPGWMSDLFYLYLKGKTSQRIF